MVDELFERSKPDFDALTDLRALQKTRNNHLGAEISRDILELVILREEHQRFRSKPLAEDVVANPALPERNDMLDFLPGFAQPAIQRER